MARKVEQEMLKAIRLRTSAELGNTTVQVNEEGTVTVSLHGNQIAKLYKSGMLNISLAGWDTPTTRSRLRAILSEQGHSLSHVGGVTVFNGRTRVPLTGWFSVVGYFT